MKVRLHEVGRRLGMHPANLAVYLAQMNVSFDDFWPAVEEDWVQALQSTHRRRFGDKGSSEGAIQEAEVQQTKSLPITKFAAFVVEKLWRNRKWGAARVSREQMQKHTHFPPADLEAALHELVEKGLLTSEGRAGPYSLNPTKRGEIERIAKLALRAGE